MNHRTHMYLMAGMVAIGALLYFTGVLGGSALTLLWVLGCVGMMVAMMWGMRRAPRDGEASGEREGVASGSESSRHH